MTRVWLNLGSVTAFRDVEARVLTDQAPNVLVPCQFELERSLRLVAVLDVCPKWSFVQINILFICLSLNIVPATATVMNTKVGVKVVFDPPGREIIGFDRRILFDQVKCNVFHKPLERLAVESLSQLNLAGNVAGIDGLVIGSSGVNVFLVLVHPDFGNPAVVLNKPF